MMVLPKIHQIQGGRKSHWHDKTCVISVTTQEEAEEDDGALDSVENWRNPMVPMRAYLEIRKDNLKTLIKIVKTVN